MMGMIQGQENRPLEYRRNSRTRPTCMVNLKLSRKPSFGKNIVREEFAKTASGSMNWQITLENN